MMTVDAAGGGSRRRLEEEFEDSDHNNSHHTDENSGGLISKVLYPFSILSPTRWMPGGSGTNLQTVLEEDNTDHYYNNDITGGVDDDPHSLEGILFHKKGGNSSMKPWRRRYVVLNLTDGGSLSCYRFTNKRKYTSKALRQMYTTLHRGSSIATNILLSPLQSSSNNNNNSNQHEPQTPTTTITPQSPLSPERSGSAMSPLDDNSTTISAGPDQILSLRLSASVPWIARDIENDQSAFVIEIPYEYFMTELQGRSSDDFSQILHDDDEEEDDDESDFGNGHRQHFSLGSDTDSVGLNDLYSLASPNNDMNIEADDSFSIDSETAASTQSQSQLMQHRKRSSSVSTTSTTASPSRRRSGDEQYTGNRTSTSYNHKDLRAAQKRKKPLRFYFQCPRKGNEKGLWLRALAKVDRLSHESRKKKKLFGKLSHVTRVSRIRSPLSGQFARASRQLEHGYRYPINSRMNQHNPDVIDRTVSSRYIADALHAERTKVSSGTNSNDAFRNYKKSGSNNGSDSDLSSFPIDTIYNKEYRVQPSYAYPHRWMTHEELRDEMILPSSKFHDLRINNMPKGEKAVAAAAANCAVNKNNETEIGILRVEVLQCLGLPRIDTKNDNDSVVYCVCGSHAFSTDIIPTCSSPMWLSKMRRACIFPIFHAYARLYVGVFDDDPKKEKNDFVGRVAIDIARLRPRSQYDVTLPLRQSAHVYTRRPRGAIRLRFHLEWHNNKEVNALLSYLPKKIRKPRRRLLPGDETTVQCSDPKAFRNVTMTVHGTHLDRRFSTSKMNAVIKEINFTRVMIIWLIRKSLRDLIVWMNPAISLLVFLAWMHCIYANSFRLVPAYIFSFLVLLLTRNYARYGIDRPAQMGFLQMTIEEMLRALVGDSIEAGLSSLTKRIKKNDHQSSPKNNDSVGPSQQHQDKRQSSYSPKSDNENRRQRIAPIDMRTKLASPSSSVDGSVGKRSFTSGERVIQTHNPLGKRVFRLLGFYNNGIDDDKQEDHFEFPWASGIDYPLFSVKESLESSQPNDTKSKKSRESGSINKNNNNSGNIANIPSRENSEIVSISSADTSRRERASATAERNENSIGIPREVTKGTDFSSAWDDQDDFDVLSDEGEFDVDVGNVGITSQSRTTNNQNKVQHYNNNESTEVVAHLSTTQTVVRKEKNEWPKKPRLPGQNVDVVVKSGRKLTDDLDDIKRDMNKFTFNLFNDRTYVIKDPDARFARDSKGRRRQLNESKKTKKASDGNNEGKEAKRELEKLLNVGQYSHPNPVIARIGLYIEPIVGASYPFLSCFRVLFNVFTWRDPILTFWLYLALVIITAVLFIFPWRIFLFIVGAIGVGPQNWLIRKWRERHGIKKPSNEDKFKPWPDGVKYPNADDDFMKQPVFKGHAPLNQVPSDSIDPNIQPNEVHHVVVPYSPLTYQRFNDWPPEYQYARVKADKIPQRPVLQGSKSSSGVMSSSSPSKPKNMKGRGTSHPPMVIDGNSIGGTTTGIIGRPRGWLRRGRSEDQMFPPAVSNRSRAVSYDEVSFDNTQMEYQRQNFHHPNQQQPRRRINSLDNNKDDGGGDRAIQNMISASQSDYNNRINGPIINNNAGNRNRSVSYDYYVGSKNRDRTTVPTTPTIRDLHNKWLLEGEQEHHDEIVNDKKNA